MLLKMWLLFIVLCTIGECLLIYLSINEFANANFSEYIQYNLE